jgi:ABC-type dipeptide/oligopeptide/nickel transport system ATPase component
MRAGGVVESGPRHQLFTAPQHEYTRSLLAALPGSTFEEDPAELAAGLVAGSESPEAPVAPQEGNDV